MYISTKKKKYLFNTIHLKCVEKSSPAHKCTQHWRHRKTNNTCFENLEHTYAHKHTMSLTHLTSFFFVFRKKQK